MTTAQLADLIIVGSFFGILGSVAGHIIGKAICWVIDRVKTMRDRRGKGKENEGTPSGFGNQEQR